MTEPGTGGLEARRGIPFCDALVSLSRILGLIGDDLGVLDTVRSSQAGRWGLMSGAEEEHARLMLSGELGVDVRLHDNGSRPSMPDLLSVDGKHVAEVITTAPSAIREAENNLPSMVEPRLPHCVEVSIP